MKEKIEALIAQIRADFPDLTEKDLESVQNYYIDLLKVIKADAEDLESRLNYAMDLL